MLARAVSVALGTGLVLLGGVAPAAADGWGSVSCAQNPDPSCHLGTGTSGGAPTDPPSSAPKSGGGPRPSEPATPPEVIDPTTVHCTYVRSDYQAPPPGAATPILYERHATFTIRAAVWVADPAPAVPAATGAWYVYKCDGDGAANALFRPPVWIPDNAATPTLPDPVVLAQQAYNDLRLPAPLIELSPPGEQLVNLPTWLWLNTSRWGARSAVAAVPGESVTAVAVPRSVTWRFGDGNSVTCQGPGTRYTAADPPGSPSPDCGYVFRRSSAGQPEAVFTVTATAHWQVTWSGAGTGGVFPDLTTTAQIQVPVAEAQALNTD